MIIAVDGGTTNTRFALVEAGKVVDRIKCQIGVRDSINSGRQVLEKAVRDGISELLGRNSLEPRDIGFAAFSGMIGTENGIFSVSHIAAPAGIAELLPGSHMKIVETDAQGRIVSFRTTLS